MTDPRMRILIATDAAAPQVNGVVTTYERLARELAAQGVEPAFLTPNDFLNVPCPGYSEIRLALPNFDRACRHIDRIAPDLIHIATEGPVGWMTRSACRADARPFTTSYHTKFPEYASALLGLPTAPIYQIVRRFHADAAGTMVATPSLAKTLRRRGFKRLLPWTRGVDTTLFRPRCVRLFGPGPIFLNVGRISREKNIEAFLSADLPGRKVVVGDGPMLPALGRAYPDVTFTGPKSGEDLARCYASADVFVFPSRTDTFGLVLLEAMASGLPIVAYPVTGPLDVVKQNVSGVLHDDLATAALAALKLDPEAARAHALTFSWSRAAELFLDNITFACAAESRSTSRPQLPALRRIRPAPRSGVGCAK
ncbi:MAG: glycosyltransferase family 4 protein [Hyphomicrobium sp.]